MYNPAGTPDMDGEERQESTAETRRAARRSVLISGTLVLAALLPVALLSVLSYRLAARRMLDLVRSGNASAAAMTGELVRSDLARNVDMARALAAQPDMMAAVGRRDADAVRQRLKATVDAINRETVAGSPAAAPATAPGTAPPGDIAGRRIDRAFVADPAGVEWSDYPYAPESIGKSFAHRDWYRGVSRDWQPYLSEVYQRNSEPRILIVAMAAPVRGPGGDVIGILVFQMPLEYVSRALRSIQVGIAGGSGHVYVVDRNGTVVAHPLLPDLQTRHYTEPAGSEPVRRAIDRRSGTAEYVDPISGRRMVAAFQSIPVPNGTWAAVAQQPADEVYGPVRRLGISIAVAGTVVAATGFLLVGTLRRASVRDRRMSRALDAKGERLAKLAAELEDTATAERQARIAEQAAHDRLRQAQGRLVQSEKLAALGQLVAGVAHEINNPLAFVLNNVAVLQRDLRALEELIRLYQLGDGALDQHAPDVMTRVRALSERIDLPYTMKEIAELPVRTREGLARIQHIVKDLRDFARQNAIGDVQPGCDLNSGIESTINIARGTARKHQVELVSDLQPLPGVTCAPGKINQVVLNLITNAVHASSEGGRVIVRTRHVDGGVQIEVADNGAGIDPAIRGRIFDPFFTTKPQGEGTGLGLSISHGIVADHGGRIDVESEPGAGTTFTVFLPLAPPGAPAGLPAAGRRTVAAGDGPTIPTGVG
jgi:signal transduction histidine kinase